MLTAAALAASIMSCNRDQVVPVPDAPPAITQANQELAAVAKALARTLGSEAAYRQLLKAEALKQFDGDYDVLYRAFAAQQPAFGQRMDELVAQSPSSQSLTGMADVLAHVPNLNISVPVNITKWSANTYAPLVLFIPADFDEKTYTKPLQAYDKDGQVHLLDAKQAPDYPVVVIGPSERVRGTALTSENFGPGKGAVGGAKGGGNTTNRVPADDPTNPGDPYYPYPPTPTPPPTGQPYRTCRVDRQTEFLRSLWMKDVSYYEAWLLGGPEIRLQILAPTGVSGNGGGLYSGTFSMPRLHIEDIWYCDNDLVVWDKTRYTDVLKYVWIEEDGGITATIETSIEYTIPGGPRVSAKVTFEKATLDDVIGGGPKDIDFGFCPDPSRDYYSIGGGTSEFRWSLQNRP